MEKPRISEGNVVKHFKGNLYVFLHIAKHTETGEKLAIYQGLEGERRIFARPYDMFMDKVDKEKYPDCQQEYRLEKYAENEEILIQRRNHRHTLACLSLAKNNNDPLYYGLTGKPKSEHQSNIESKAKKLKISEIFKKRRDKKCCKK